MPAFAISIQHCTGDLAKTIKEEAKKATQIGTWVGKLSLFTGDIILNTENPKESTQKKIKLTNEFSGRI